MNFIIFIIMSCRGFGQGFVWAEMMNVVELDQGQSCFQKKKKKRVVRIPALYAPDAVATDDISRTAAVFRHSISDGQE